MVDEAATYTAIPPQKKQGRVYVKCPEGSSPQVYTLPPIPHGEGSGFLYPFMLISPTFIQHILWARLSDRPW